MIRFHCSYRWDDGSKDTWHGTIKQIIHFGSHYEVFILSRSSLRVLVGKSSTGLFAGSYGKTMKMPINAGQSILFII